MKDDDKTSALEPAAPTRGSTRWPCAKACRRAHWGENSEALFLTSSFVHPDAATAAARFANEEEAFVYSRFTNPTVTMMERRLAALEGTEACIGTASGMGAILLMVHGAAEGRRPRRSARTACSARRSSCSAASSRKFGVETTFVSQTDVGAVARRGAAEHAGCCSPRRRPTR